MRHLPLCKTKFVCTIGPASNSIEMLKKMISSGMNVARLNFSHGDFIGHGEVIKNIRVASHEAGRPVAIMADLPGPKMRLGVFSEEPVHLETGDTFTLTSKDIQGNRQRASMSFPRLPKVVKKNDILFLNDGLVQLKVLDVHDQDVVCIVEVGGELRSRKGLNLPGIDLGISAFTSHDRACLEFALKNGVDAISQSFVNDASDIEDVRKAAHDLGYDPFIIAKIERAEIHQRLDSILEASDGIMVARGDLGVEIPIEQIATAQKEITAKANLFGKPVITATQMLESMTSNRRPTRAEATDVANAILDGTDCVMLSEESATGQYPLEALQMLVSIASVTEPSRPDDHFQHILSSYIDEEHKPGLVDLIACNVKRISNKLDIAAIISPTASGLTARRLTRFRLSSWIIAATPSQKTCQDLLFSYGVFPLDEESHPEDWTEKARSYVSALNLNGEMILLVEGPSPARPETNHRLEIIKKS